MLHKISRKIEQKQAELNRLHAQISGDHDLADHFPLGRVGYQSGAAARRRGASLEKTIDLSKQAVTIQGELKVLKNALDRYEKVCQRIPVLETMIAKGEYRGVPYTPDDIRSLVTMLKDYQRQKLSIERVDARS